tara:strand:+ start:3787 stop:5205 length:1419 start_codon:yes stop_codon:yes gene_type:complete
MVFNKKLSFEDKELAILREAVDKAQKKIKRQNIMSPMHREIVEQVEHFLRSKKCICYGGTAINNILPINDQFYDKTLEMPDYDFYSDNALNLAKQLADIYAKKGFSDVQAKAGMHHGTYKVFVNYIPVADITHMDKKLFNLLKKDSIKVNGILYAPPDFLRMSMYLELSRPKGDVSRWEKVQKRLVLLNKNYPIKNIRCNYERFQRGFETHSVKKKDEKTIYDVVKNSFINQGLIFFGGYANDLFSRYMPTKERKILADIPDFDVLSEDPKTSAVILIEQLEYHGFKKVKYLKHPGVGEIIAPHYEIRIGKETIAFIYKPLACHSFNIINIKGVLIKVASIDTMLSFYLAFMYADRIYYDKDRILCMCQYLFNVQEKNRLKQKGLLKRFSTKCYGEQESINSIREKKSVMYQKLKNKRNSKEYESWFLKYSPSEKNTLKINKKTKTKKNKKTKTKKNKKIKTKTKKIKKTNL